MRATAYITLAAAVGTIAVAALTILYRYTAVAAPLALAAGHRARYRAHGGGDEEGAVAKRSRSEPGMSDVARAEGVLDLVTAHLDRESIRNLALVGREYRDSVQRAPAELRARPSMRLHPSFTSDGTLQISSIAFSPGMDTVAVVDDTDTGKIKIFDQRTGGEMRTLEILDDSYNDSRSYEKRLVYDETGKHLAYINNAFISIWDLVSATGRIIRYRRDYLPPRVAQFRGDTIMVTVPSTDLGYHDTFICNIADEQVRPFERKNGRCLGPRENTLICLSDDYSTLKTLNYGNVTYESPTHKVDDPGYVWSHVTSTTDGRMVAAFKNTRRQPSEFSEPRIVYLFDLEANTHLEINVTGDAREMMRKVELTHEHSEDLAAMGVITSNPVSSRVSHDGRIVLVNHVPEFTFEEDGSVYPGFEISSILLSEDKQLLLVHLLDKLFQDSAVILYDAQTRMLHKQFIIGYSDSFRIPFKFEALLGDRENGYHIHAKKNFQWFRWDVPPLDRHVMSAWREKLLQ